MALAEIIPEASKPIANCNETPTTSDTAEPQAREGHTWQADEKGLGGLWNQLHGGYPTPERFEVAAFQYNYQTVRTVRQLLRAAGIDFQIEKNAKGLHVVLVVAEFRQKAAQVLKDENV